MRERLRVASTFLAGKQSLQPSGCPCRAGRSLVFTAWPHQASNFPNLRQRLGIVYCMNRQVSMADEHAVLPVMGEPALQMHLGTWAICWRILYMLPLSCKTDLWAPAASHMKLGLGAVACITLSQLWSPDALCRRHSRWCCDAP